MDLKYACIEVLIPSMLEYLDCEDCKTGDWVDLEDSVGKWWFAEVIDIASHGLAKMNYVGWSHKYDEWIQWGDPRIARIHTHIFVSRYYCPCHFPEQVGRSNCMIGQRI